MSYDKVFRLRLTSAQMERLKELGSKSSASDYLRSCIDGFDETVSPGSQKIVIDVAPIVKSARVAPNRPSSAEEKRLSAERLQRMVDAQKEKAKK